MLRAWTRDGHFWQFLISIIDRFQKRLIEYSGVNRILAPAVMRCQQRAETRARTGFTIDVTSYKVLIIMLMSLMFMADLCYIFIYIIKWFLKSPACFRSHTKYENNFNWSMHTVEQIWWKKSLLHYYRIIIFFKEISKSNMTISINNNNKHETKHW